MSMAGSYVGFDPYQQWLGIPPHEQPPHLYRLLGLQLFEPDLQAIALSADRLLGYLGTVSDPAYAPIASRIYEEIITARTTLTDPYRKAQYDAWLQQNAYAGQMGMMNPAMMNPGMMAPGMMAPGYTSTPSHHGQAGYDQAGYGQPSGYVSTPSNHGYTNGVQGYDAGQGYANGVQGYAPGAQGYAQSPQGYAAQGYPDGAQGYAQGAQGYAQGAQGYSQGVEGYSQPQPQTYAAPQSAPVSAPMQAPMQSAPLNTSAVNDSASAYGATAASYGMNTMSPSGGPVPMVPQAPSQVPAPSVAAAAPEMAASGWQVGARPVVTADEPEIKGSGPNPMTMLYAGAGVLVLIIVIGIFRNMEDKKPARVLASNTGAEPNKSVPNETKIKAPSTPDVAKPAPPDSAPVANPNDNPTPVEDPEPPTKGTPVTVPDPTPPEPLPTRPEPKKPPVKADPDPEMEPEPKPEPKKPEPKKTEPKKTDPETEPGKPETPATDPAVVKKASDMLGKVRLALANRDIPLAKQRLQAAKAMNVEPVAQEVARLEMLTSNLEDFWGAVRKSLESLRNVDEVTIGETRVSVVEASGDKLVLRVKGVNKTYHVDSMSAKLSLFLADRWYKPIPSSKIFKGSFHALDSQGDRKEAKALWEAARREGSAGEKEVVELLLPELGVAPPQGEQTVGTLGIE